MPEVERHFGNFLKNYADWEDITVGLIERWRIVSRLATICTFLYHHTRSHILFFDQATKLIEETELLWNRIMLKLSACTIKRWSFIKTWMVKFSTFICFRDSKKVATETWRPWTLQEWWVFPGWTVSTSSLYWCHLKVESNWSIASKR